MVRARVLRFGLDEWELLRSERMNGKKVGGVLEGRPGDVHLFNCLLRRASLLGTYYQGLTARNSLSGTHWPLLHDSAKTRTLKRLHCQSGYYKGHKEMQYKRNVQ